MSLLPLLTGVHGRSAMVSGLQVSFPSLILLLKRLLNISRFAASSNHHRLLPHDSPGGPAHDASEGRSSLRLDRIGTWNARVWSHASLEPDLGSGEPGGAADPRWVGTGDGEFSSAFLLPLERHADLPRHSFFFINSSSNRP